MAINAKSELDENIEALTFRFSSALPNSKLALLARYANSALAVKIELTASKALFTFNSGSVLPNASVVLLAR